LNKLRAIDLFCCAGGSSWGAQLAGAEIVAGFDAWDIAGVAFKENFPSARFYHGLLENNNPKKIQKEIGKIDLILASPECTNHSPAKGNSPRSEMSRATAFQVVRYVKVFLPRWVVIENVIGMRNWSRYSDFCSCIESYGYQITPHVLNSKDFAVPQTRRRLFLFCDRKVKAGVLEIPQKAHVPASEILNINGKYSYTPLRSDRRAEATIERAERAIAVMGNNPFILVYYGSDKAGGWQKLDRPLRTITTLDRFALVKKENGDHVMRMLQVPELKMGMGLPQKFSVGETTRRNSIRMIGNAVCPPVMRAVIRHMIAAR
jgi:DNA (cytosine-5)-methyltransferase 1